MPDTIKPPLSRYSISMAIYIEYIPTNTDTRCRHRVGCRNLLLAQPSRHILADKKDCSIFPIIARNFRFIVLFFGRLLHKQKTFRIFASTLRITGNGEDRPANVKGGTKQNAERLETSFGIFVAQNSTFQNILCTFLPYVNKNLLNFKILLYEKDVHLRLFR